MYLTRLFLLNLFLLSAIIASGQPNSLPDGIYAEFNTNRGKIVVKLEYEKTPMTVANFIGLAEGTIKNSSYPPGKPFFTGSIWHRVVKGHVIQGGEPSSVKDPANSDVNSIGYEIPNEISDLKHNKAGMIGMANDGPNTNTCEYYITLADRSYLDGNYTLFGEVVDGMDVVNSIAKGDTTYSINIKRLGPDTEKFIVNDSSFKVLLDNQWKKVNMDKQEKKIKEEAFISSNYTGINMTADSLRYKILTEGEGSSPNEGSKVYVKYEGKLISGLTFVSSADDGKPIPSAEATVFTHDLGKEGLIKGLNEALKVMKTGEKRLLIIPPELAYGTRAAFYGKEISGKRFVISPGETLVLEVTLVKFDN
jgi:cyclophilin family peptidyl-prolyl cis-trans isomerase